MIKMKRKRLYFQRLFSIQFFKCMEVFSGTNDYDELKGFKKFKVVKNILKDKHEREYIDILESYLKNYKENIKYKRGRKSKQKNEENEKEIN